MSPFDSSESDSPDSNPISSGNIETPRGGFMARPGLKSPPRHAVVVRVGDAPESEHIPVARSSFPPPPPPSAPAPESLSEKITLRAIPTPRAASVAPAPEPAAAAVVPVAVVESVPPPSDAPVVASVDFERVTPTPRSRRVARSRLTILAAAAAGLILGIVSVVTTVSVREAASAGPLGAAAAPMAQALPAATPTGAASAATNQLAAPRPVEATRQPGPPSESSAKPGASGAPRAPAHKRSIF